MVINRQSVIVHEGYEPLRAPRKSICDNTSIDDGVVAQLFFKEITKFACSKSSSEL
jgi:hypothetical protein